MTKIAIVDENEEISSSVVKHTGAEHRRLANQVMKEALNKAGLSFDEISYVIATGYGRITVPFADKQITELTCHARGIYRFLPNTRLAIDIGGQDVKGLKIKNGKLLDFIMSDKCAAGTGRFLELIAQSLGINLDDFGNLSLQSTNQVSISSVCTVFARKEVIHRISEGVAIKDILAGVHDSIAVRVTRLVERLNIDSDVAFIGGVANNIGVVKALEKNIGCRVFVPEEPMLTGAIGAALLGKELVQKAGAAGKTIKRVERHLSEASFHH